MSHVQVTLLYHIASSVDMVFTFFSVTEIYCISFLLRKSKKPLSVYMHLIRLQNVLAIYLCNLLLFNILKFYILNKTLKIFF